MVHGLNADAVLHHIILAAHGCCSPLQITHRETMADVTEQTGAAVVTRGIFIPSGQKVPEGERKLGLLIQVTMCCKCRFGLLAAVSSLEAAACVVLPTAVAQLAGLASC